MRVLVIDDDTFILALLARQLRALGVERVETCGNAIEALALIDLGSADFDLLFCDLNMPEMDGVELVRHLAERRFAGGVVLVSGEDERTLGTVRHLARARRLRVLGALSKPVAPEQLGEILDRVASPANSGLYRIERPVYGPEDLRVAMSRGELVNHYQPQIDLDTGRLTGMETLVRWQHPQDGLLYPVQFVSTAERHGLIDELTGIVLEGALAQARQWLRAGLDLQVSVNVSMDNLVTLDFPDTVAATLAAADMPVSSLVLEVTESRLMQDRLVTLDIATRLRLRRISLSIDDFGTGFSSLVQLRDIPFDELKLDRSFVHGASRNPALHAIVEANIRMAQQLGMRVVAEGIENREDWDYVIRSGCDRAQGYFIARPMPGENLPRWLAAWTQRQVTLRSVS